MFGVGLGFHGAGSPWVGLLNDLEDCPDSAFGSANAEQSSHRLGNPALSTDNLALVVVGDFQPDDYPAVLLLLGHHHIVRGVGDEPGEVFDQLFHPSLTLSKVPALFRSLATLSVGCAPFLSQPIAFSSLMVRAGGSGDGIVVADVLDVPTVPGGTRIGDDNPVLGVVLGPDTAEPDF